MSLTRVVVILPARNEEGAIGPLVRALCDAGATTLVVDNGSTDHTAVVARAAGARVVFEPEAGYGAACLRGVASALDLEESPDVLVFMDADGSDPPEELPRLMVTLEREGVDLVLGVRRSGTSGHRAMEPAQRFGNWLAPMLMRRLFGAPFTDMPSFKVIRAGALRTLDLDDRGYGFTIQFLLRAYDRGLSVREVPIEYRPRVAGVSKVSGSLRASVRAGTRILWTLGLYAVARARA